MREVTRRSKSPSDEQYRFVTLNFLNTMLGETRQSRDYWAIVQEDIQIKYPEILFPEEKIQDYFFYQIKEKKLDLKYIFQLFFKMTGIQVTEATIKALDANRNDEFEFLQPDLVTMDCKVSRVGIIEYADGMSLFYEAMERSKQNSSSRIRLLGIKVLKSQS